ncbi:unnamed protein product, partial [Didymodactylos carnosus]
RMNATNNNNTATLQIDWSESYVLKQSREEKSAYYCEQKISLGTGYVWSQKESYGFGCLSDHCNHMGEAAWASLLQLLKTLVNRNDIKYLNIISDSPVSQYRNKTIMFLVAQFAKQNRVEIKWIYLESGHGKGAADGVGVVIKLAMNEAVSFNPDATFANAKDLLDNIKNRLNIKLFIYATDDIEKVKQTLPKLKSIKETLELHEISANSDGLLRGKKLSDDSNI